MCGLDLSSSWSHASHGRRADRPRCAPLAGTRWLQHGPATIRQRSILPWAPGGTGWLDGWWAVGATARRRQREPPIEAAEVMERERRGRRKEEREEQPRVGWTPGICVCHRAGERWLGRALGGPRTGNGLLSPIFGTWVGSAASGGGSRREDGAADRRGFDWEGEWKVRSG